VLNKKITFLLCAAFACCIAIFPSCKSNPAASAITYQFSLTQGSSYIFTLTAVDSNNAPIPDSLKTIHESIVSAGVTYAGVSNAFCAIDTVYNTSNKIISIDSVFYETNGVYLLQYGFLAWMINTYTGASTLKGWDTIAYSGSPLWTVNIADNVNTGMDGSPIPVNYSLYGEDIGDSSVEVDTTYYEVDRASLHGTLVGSGNASGFPITASAKLSANIYTTYNPTILGLVNAPPIVIPVLNNGNLITTQKFNGFIRTLISYAL